MRKRLFVDMDGTIARFHDDPDCLIHMYVSGFFYGLKPYGNVVDGLRCFIKKNRSVEVAVLTSVIGTKCCPDEKAKWLGKYLPEVSNLIFVPQGKRKSSCIPMLCRNDILLDDYNKNLAEWEADGGASIKLVNHVNHRGKIGKKWKGNSLRYDDEPEKICRQLMDGFHFGPLQLCDFLSEHTA